MRNLLVLIVIVLPIFLYAHDVTKRFTLTGIIAGSNNDSIFLAYPHGGGRFGTDTAIIKNGRFFFTGVLEHPVKAFLRIPRQGAWMGTELFIEAAEIKVTLNATDDATFNSPIVRGSVSQNEYAGLRKSDETIEKRWQVVIDTLTAVAKRDNFQFQALKDWVLVPYFQEKKDAAIFFINNHLNSCVAASVLEWEARDMTTDSVMAIFNKLKQPVKQCVYAKNILDDIKKRSIGVPGTDAGNFTTADIENKNLSLADFRGKYVLLDFWASWCLPCRKQGPHLKELYAKYRSRGFEVIGIADDEGTQDDWKKAVAKDSLPWRHILKGKTGNLLDRYNINSLPTQLLIDPNGQIIARYGDNGDDFLMLDQQLETAFSKIIFSGKTSALFNGTKIVMYNNVTKDKDSAIVKDGGFTFLADYKGPSCYYFYSEAETKKNNGSYEPFGILVTAPGKTAWIADMENLQASQVLSSKENELYLQFNKDVNMLTEKLYNGLYKKYGKGFVQNPDKNSTKYAALIADFGHVRADYKKGIYEKIKTLAKQNPLAYAPAYALFIYKDMIGLPDVEELVNLLEPVYKNSYEEKQVLSFIETSKATAIGSIAPDFSQPDTAGLPIQLSSFRGKYVLLDFWASWCGPCRAEAPNLVTQYQKFRQKGFTILSISLDKPGARGAWLGAIHKDNLTWTNVSDLAFWDNAAAKQYGVQSIPQNYLLDTSGKIVAVNLHGDGLEKKLQEILQ